MANSAAITQMIIQSSNPEETKQQIWDQSRYLISQKPSVATNSFTGDGWYEGCTVIPAPLAKVGSRQFSEDLATLEATQYIRFVDSNATDGADDEVREALFRPMTNTEADSYEAQLRELLGITE